MRRVATRRWTSDMHYAKFMHAFFSARALATKMNVRYARGAIPCVSIKLIHGSPANTTDALTVKNTVAALESYIRCSAKTPSLLRLWPACASTKSSKYDRECFSSSRRFYSSNTIEERLMNDHSNMITDQLHFSIDFVQKGWEVGRSGFGFRLRPFFGSSTVPAVILDFFMGDDQRGGFGSTHPEKSARKRFEGAAIG